MNKILSILVLFLSISSFSQDELKRNIYFGNQAYTLENYDDAIEYFELAIEESPLDFKANFNLGNAYFMKEDFEKAGNIFSTIAELGITAYDKSKAYHNLGNSLMAQQKLDEAIEAYEEGLRLNPQDEGTRYNLAYALLLKQQQDEQEKENQENSEDGQEGEEGENSDENSDKQEGDQGNDNNDEQDGDEGDNNSDENDENDEEGNNSSEGDNDEGEEKDEGSNQEPNKISKEQARRILENALKREKEVQKQIDQKKKIGTGTSKKKDW